jgi:hypothetical protein
MSTIQPTQGGDHQASHPSAQVQVTILANAATTVAVVAYLLCAVLAIVAPDLWIGLIQSWTHGLSLAPLRPSGPWFRLDEFIVGLITFGASVWLVIAAIAALYNRWSRG